MERTDLGHITYLRPLGGIYRHVHLEYLYTAFQIIGQDTGQWARSSESSVSNSIIPADAINWKESLTASRSGSCKDLPFTIIFIPVCCERLSKARSTSSHALFSSILRKSGRKFVLSTTRTNLANAGEVMVLMTDANHNTKSRKTWNGSSRRSSNVRRREQVDRSNLSTAPSVWVQISPSIASREGNSHVWNTCVRDSRVEAHSRIMISGLIPVQ